MIELGEFDKCNCEEIVDGLFKLCDDIVGFDINLIFKNIVIQGVYEWVMLEIFGVNEMMIFEFFSEIKVVFDFVIVNISDGDGEVGKLEDLYKLFLDNFDMFGK